MIFDHGETVTITTPGAPTGVVDSQGNPIPGADVVTSLTGVAVTPLDGAESLELFGSVAITGYRIFAAYGSTVPTNAVVTVRGEACNAEAIMQHRSAFDGWEACAEIIVRKGS